MALLLALSADPEDIEVLLISVTFGNVEVQKLAHILIWCGRSSCFASCLRNVVSMFHVIENEMAWRRDHGLPEGFDTLKRSKPTVAVGAEKPLGDQSILADYFRMSEKLHHIVIINPLAYLFGLQQMALMD